MSGDIRRMSAPPPSVTQHSGVASDSGLVRMDASGTRPRL